MARASKVSPLPPVRSAQFSLAGEHDASQIKPVAKSLAEDGKIDGRLCGDAAIEVSVSVGGQERRLDLKSLEHGRLAGLADLRIQARGFRQCQGLSSLLGDQVRDVSRHITDVEISGCVRLDIGPQPRRAALDPQVVAEMERLRKLACQRGQVEVALEPGAAIGSRRHAAFRLHCCPAAM